MMAFDEVIICEQGYTISLINLSDGDTDISSMIEPICFENQLLFNKVGNWADFYTDSLKLTVEGLFDTNGNTSDTSIVFIVDYQQKETSPVSIKSVEDSWYMSNKKDTVQFVISGFDLAQLEYGLDSIVVQHKLNDPTVHGWTDLVNISFDELVASSKYVGSVAHDTVTWRAKDGNGDVNYIDGDYLVRALAHYDNIVSFSQ